MEDYIKALKVVYEYERLHSTKDPVDGREEFFQAHLKPLVHSYWAGLRSPGSIKATQIVRYYKRMSLEEAVKYCRKAFGDRSSYTAPVKGNMYKVKRTKYNNPFYTTLVCEEHQDALAWYNVDNTFATMVEVTDVFEPLNS